MIIKLFKNTKCLLFINVDKQTEPSFNYAEKNKMSPSLCLRKICKALFPIQYLNNLLCYMSLIPVTKG